MVGIRREDKNQWERRVPLVPEDVRELTEKGYKFIVQPSPIRAFKEEDYIKAGAIIKEDLSETDVILGIKEVPVEKILPDKLYMIFSHTVKGQKHNMPMLRRFMEQRCTLIDYELIKDHQGRRLIFFGKYAGNAGIIDTLHFLGKRLELEGIHTPFPKIKRAHIYGSLSKAEVHIKEIGEIVRKEGLPDSIVPLVVGIAGYGHVSQGVQEVLSWFPTEEVSPEDIDKIPHDRHKIFKVVFKEEHMVERANGGEFDLQEYYNSPELYRPIFHKYLPYFTVLINAIYWDERYPRLLTKEKSKEYKNWKLKIIGDISCDIEGAIEITVKATDPGNPVFVYNPETGKITDGYSGQGIVVMAVDNLPGELPVDASREFSGILKNFIPHIVKNIPENFNEWTLPSFLKRAVMVFKGELTSDYKYLEKKLKEVE